MKFLISLFLLSVIVAPAAAQKFESYIFAGISGYVDNEELGAVKSGIGLRGGVGLQFNSRFGVEYIFDYSPSLDPPKAAELLAAEISVLTAPFEEFDIKVRVQTTRTSFNSVVGTLTYPAWDRWSWFFKGGLTNTSFEVDVKLTSMSFVNHKERDLAGTFSAGLSLRRNEERSMEFSLVHTTGDAQSVSAHATFKHHF